MTGKRKKKMFTVFLIIQSTFYSNLTVEMSSDN